MLAGLTVEVGMAERIQEGTAWKCSVCGGFIRADATLCKHCKAVFTGEGIVRPAPAAKRKINPLVAIGVIALLIIGGLYLLISTGPAIEGQRGRLNSGGSRIIATRDRATYDQIGSLTPAQLINNPNIIFVNDGTSVVVLSVEVPRTQVRITEGEFVGEEVWVLTSWVAQK